MKTYFQENKNNLCKTWKGVKLLKKTNNVQPPSIKINDKILSDTKSIATKVKDSFGSIAHTVNKKTPKSKANHKQYLRYANINSVQLNPVTEEEIKKIMV